MRAIRIACGSAYVASSYGYPVVGVFEYATRVLRNGETAFGPGEMIAGPFRSRREAERIARQEAARRGVPYREGYGTLCGERVSTSHSPLRT